MYFLAWEHSFLCVCLLPVITSPSFLICLFYLWFCWLMMRHFLFLHICSFQSPLFSLSMCPLYLLLPAILNTMLADEFWHWDLWINGLIDYLLQFKVSLYMCVCTLAFYYDLCLWAVTKRLIISIYHPN